jgi:hypothetical protein
MKLYYSSAVFSLMGAILATQTSGSQRELDMAEVGKLSQLRVNGKVRVLDVRVTKRVFSHLAGLCVASVSFVEQASPPHVDAQPLHKPI